MNKKSGTMVGAIGAIVFVVYNLLVFMAFKGFNNVFWTSYAFAVIAFAICCFCFFYSLKDISVQTAFFGIPLMSFSLYFLIVEFIVSIIFMALRNVVNIKLAIFIQVLVLAIFLVIAIISILAKDVSVKTNDKIRQDVKYVQSFRVSLEGYADRCQDPAAKKAIEALAETARYSDQRSNPNTIAVEQRIQTSISNIEIAINNNDYQAVLNFCNQASMAFAERDRLLRLG